jgi:hypothetical protein
MHRPDDEDEGRPADRLKKGPKPLQPGPPKKEGDDSPNPLPDDPGGSVGGDPGRT